VDTLYNKSPLQRRINADNFVKIALAFALREQFDSHNSKWAVKNNISAVCINVEIWHEAGQSLKYLLFVITDWTERLITLLQ